MDQATVIFYEVANAGRPAGWRSEATPAEHFARCLARGAASQACYSRVYIRFPDGSTEWVKGQFSDDTKRA